MKALPKLPQGQGSFSYKQHGSKTIRYRKTVGTIITKRLEVYGNSIDECMDAMREAESEYLAQEWLRRPDASLTKNVTLEEGIRLWVDTYKAHLKPKSKEGIAYIYNHHIKGTALGKLKLSNVTATDIQIHLFQTQGKSMRSAKKCYVLLREFCAYAYDGQYNPISRIKVPKNTVPFVLDEEGNLIQKDKLKTLSDSEMALLEKELVKPYVHNKGGYKNGLFLLFIMYSFIRYGESVALQYKDVDVDNGTVYIGKNYVHTVLDGKWQWILQIPKSRNSIRTLHVTDKAMRYLKEYMELKGGSGSDYIAVSPYGFPIRPDQLGAELHRAIRKAGISTDISVHGLRHTGISFFIRHGVDIKYISEMAGHSNVGITMQIYYEVVQEQKESEWEKMNGIDAELSKESPVRLEETQD